MSVSRIRVRLRFRHCVEGVCSTAWEFLARGYVHVPVRYGLRLFLIAFFSINLRLLSSLFPPSVSSCFPSWSLVSIGGVRNSLCYVLHEESLGQVIVIVLILVRRLVETGRSILVSAEFSHGVHARHRIITSATSGAPGDSILALTLVMTFQSHLRRPLSSCEHSLLRRKLALFLILR